MRCPARCEVSQYWAATASGALSPDEGGLDCRTPNPISRLELLANRAWVDVRNTPQTASYEIRVARFHISWLHAEPDHRTSDRAGSDSTPQSSQCGHSHAGNAQRWGRGNCRTAPGFGEPVLHLGERIRSSENSCIEYRLLEPRPLLRSTHRPACAGLQSSSHLTV